MAPLTIDPLTQVAFSLFEAKGVYALLLGSGLSRAAAIPTGWEITLDLIERIAIADGVTGRSDWASWYKERTGADPTYSSLLETLATSPEERRSILHRYIEPTSDDREAGRKVPTAAHYAIADLVRSGHVRVIVTVNFDRLMENALRERGVEPTIVASVDALAGAEPLTHSQCYVLKLHGDYKDARILNTEIELGSYPLLYNNVLDRVFDEHGLIVCGWSGDWDSALRSALLRAPNRRYATFWAARGELSGAAAELVRHRHGRVIPIDDANSFFTSLQLRVATLEQNQRSNPISIDLKVATTKRLLAKSEHRVQLDELFAREIDGLTSLVNGGTFSAPDNWDAQQFKSFVGRYEAATEALASMSGVMGRWGDGSELPLVVEAIRSLYANAVKTSLGHYYYGTLRSFSAVLVFTAYGLGASRAGRWNALSGLFHAGLDRPNQDVGQLIDTLFLWAWKGDEGEPWKQMDGLARHKTALSQHLFLLFEEWSTRFLGLTADFESTYVVFEMLGSLAHFERADKAAIQAELAGDPHGSWVLMPIGRCGWRPTQANRFIAELRVDPLKAALLQAGFAKRDPELLDLFIQNFIRIARRMAMS